MNLNSTHPLNRTKPMLKAALAISALLASNTAQADIEVGAHTGQNKLNMDDLALAAARAYGAALGVAMGARFGYGAGLGLTPEINVTSLNAKTTTGLTETRIKQIQTGFGARFYLGNLFLRPYGSAHLTYASDATGAVSILDGQEVEADIPGTAGMGFDAGGGLQLKILDLVYTEAFGTSARQFGDANMSTIYVGLGAGLKL